MTIYHTVLVKFTAGATLAQKEGWKEQLLKLKDYVKQIREIVSGQKLPHAKDGGWQDGAILTFDNTQDLHDYNVSPPHQAYLKATAEVVAEKLIYDMEV